MEKRRPQLRFELVPSTAWWSNVRSQVSRADWEKCKRFVRQRSGDACEICGGRGRKWPVECHEIWDYDDEKQLQTLVGLIALCPTCHSAKHIGRLLAIGDEKAIEAALTQVRFVNGWGQAHLEAALNNAFAIHSIRSEFEWDLDVSWLATIGINLPQYTWSREARHEARAGH